MDDDDDFTFPTVAAARGPTAPEGQLGCRDDDPEPHLLQLPTLPSPSLSVAASPLWPFAASIPKTTTTTTAPSPSPPLTADNEQERSAVAKEEEAHRVADEEDRMDQLWEDTPTTTTRPVATRSVAGHAHAGPPPPKQKQRAAADDVEDDDRQRAAALAHAERMDKLWESFNEDLVLRHRRDRSRGRRAKSATGISVSIKVSRAASGGGLDDPADDDDRWYLCNYDSPSSGADGDESDQETTTASSPAERRGYGCAPTMLRASSRAGGAGQFCAASPRARRRGRGRGAAAGWALLLRLFRRIFAVDKTAPSSSRSSSSIYVP